MDYALMYHAILSFITNNSNSAVEMRVKIEECFRQHNRIFNEFSTESKRFAAMKSLGFEMLKEDFIDSYETKEFVDGEEILVEHDIYAVHMSLENSLKRFLEIPVTAKKIICHVKKLIQIAEIVLNITQAKFWLQRIKSSNSESEFILPHYFYYDDVGIGNRLGSHAGTNKLALTYSFIGCLSSDMASRL
ncbi:hypothetical protein TKK_0016152 [Trichogramma kaykai]